MKVRQKSIIEPKKNVKSVKTAAILGSVKFNFIDLLDIKKFRQKAKTYNCNLKNV